MTFKQWFKFTFSLIVGCLLVLIAITFVLDPFQYYRKSTIYPVVYRKPKYLNAGLIRNFEYDSIILGSSMVQNFRLDNVKKNLGYDSPIKLSLSGATSEQEYLLFSTVQRSSKSLKNVLFGVDVFSFKKSAFDPNEINTFPKYLYDDNYINDIRYLLNMYVVRMGVKYFVNYRVKGEKSESLDFNTMYQWQHEVNDSKFSKEILIDSWKNNSSNLTTDFQLHEYKFSELKKNIDQYFLPIFLENRDVNFTIFYPPYSMLAYKQIEKNGWLDDYLQAKNYIYSKLAGLDHVEIHDLQIASEISGNLDNYKDFTHFHQKISLWSLETIRDKTYMLTNTNNTEFRDRFLSDFQSFQCCD